MQTKRQTNTTGLKVKFLGATNTKCNRIKITQMNCNKSITISQPGNMEVLQYIYLILDQTNEINFYSILVDNTQNNYHIINIDFKDNSFTNILNKF